MFVSQAHSFHQQARLAITLAWVGGYTNVVTILTCGTVTSHMSGITSNLGRDLSSGDWKPAFFGLFLLVTFFVGAATSGVCTELGRRKAWESIYVLPMVIEASLLAIFAVLLQRFDLLHVSEGHPMIYLMTGLAAFSMGLQNATITRISNGTVRTTHVTGVVTDLGSEVAQLVWWLFDSRRGKIEPHSHRLHPASLRVALLASIIGSFAFGAGLGTLGYLKVGQWVMLPPVMFLLWIIYRDIKRPIADIHSLGDPTDLDGASLPPGVAVFRLKKDRQRNGVHRMPNLTAWAARLEASTQIVILDLAHVPHLDANAAMEIHSLASRLTSDHRDLVLAGIGRDQYRALNESSATQSLIDIDNLCPDLDMALARSLNLMSQRAGTPAV
jgi:uncharacterized membrane protein YoaK (UPF0700 family)